MTDEQATEMISLLKQVLEQDRSSAGSSDPVFSHGLARFNEQAAQVALSGMRDYQTSLTNSWQLHQRCVSGRTIQEPSNEGD